MVPNIKFGIAGWSYDDWRGVVYPRSCKDTLRYCAGFVDYIEINSTFYHFPVARNCASWVRRVADLPLKFTAKLPGEFTHTLSSSGAAAAQVRDGFEPLAESGRLTTLLAQFSYRYERSRRSVDQLRWLRDQFGSVAPITVEVRHRSWSTPAALDELRELDVGVANLDYPGAGSGFGVRATGINGPAGIAYFRLHGRNADAWFDEDAGRDEVYDYEYPSVEVAGIAKRARELSERANETLVIANNHFRGKAMKLVLELLATHRDTRIPVSEPMLRRYPALGEIAESPPGMLF